MVRWFVLLSLSLAACGANSQHAPTEEVVAQSTQPAVECLPGCRVQQNMCATEASVLEGVRETVRLVECDPRCCDGQVAPAAIADADGDGVADDADQCPQEPEDRDAFKDEDGCPDPDNDEDGIPDSDDICPLDKETPNGFQDDDGCAD